MPSPDSVSMGFIVTLSNKSRSSSGPCLASPMQVGVGGHPSLPGLLPSGSVLPFQGMTASSGLPPPSAAASTVRLASKLRAPKPFLPHLWHQPQDVSVWCDLTLPSSVLSGLLERLRGGRGKAVLRCPGNSSFKMPATHLSHRFLIWSMHQLSIKPLDKMPGTPQGPGSSEDAFIPKSP